MADVLEHGDRTHDLTHIVSYRGRMGTEKDFSRFADAQFLRNRSIGLVLCLKTFFYGLRQFRGEVTLVEVVPQKASLGGLQHPTRSWIGEDDATVPITYQDTISHAIDDGFDLGLLGGNIPKGPLSFSS